MSDGLGVGPLYQHSIPDNQNQVCAVLTKALSYRTTHSTDAKQTDKQYMSSAPLRSNTTNWPDAVIDVFKSTGLRQVAYVPDAGHACLIQLCRTDATIQTVSLTTEEEGIADAAGFACTLTVRNPDELKLLVPFVYERCGPVFVDIKVTAASGPTVLPPRDGPYLKNRFRAAVLGPEATR